MTFISSEDGRARFNNGGADVDEDEGDGRAGFGGVGEGDTDNDGSSMVAHTVQWQHRL